jgi:type VI secretion system protein ImpM
MLPSVDKVGRYFPLTLALPIPEADVDFPDLLAHQAWYSRLEQIGLSALNVDFSPDELESVLAESPLALPPAAAELSQARDLFDCMRATPMAPQSFAVASIDAVPGAVHASARAIVAECVRGKSYWWSVAQDTGAAEFHCSAALPPEDYFSVLLGGSRTTELVSLDPLQALDSAGTP